MGLVGWMDDEKDTARSRLFSCSLILFLFLWGYHCVSRVSCISALATLMLT
ncbi:hypothetical protein LINPERHAP1_LOCUS16952, partial [Linum perenne]